MNLVHNPSKIIRNLLVDLGVASLLSQDTTWPAFPDKEPDEPDQAITVRQTEPELLGGSMLATAQVQRTGIQVRVRSNDRSGDKARDIADALDAVVKNSLVINDTESGDIDITYEINMMLRVNGPLYLGEDKPQSGRHLFTINFLADLKQLTP